MDVIRDYSFFLSTVALICFFIQRKVFVFAERKIFKITPVWFLTALLAVGFIARTVIIYQLKNVDEATSLAYSIGGSSAPNRIIMTSTYFTYFAVLILIAIAGCAIGIATEIITNRILKHISLKANENNRTDIQ